MDETIRLYMHGTVPATQHVAKQPRPPTFSHVVISFKRTANEHQANVASECPTNQASEPQPNR